MTLSSKETAAFQTALQQYEQKQYKSALSSVDAILKKQPKYGDALCLKGLVLYHLKRQDEVPALMQKGVEESPKSAMAWHIMGIYQKLVKNYPEAYKAYIQSYKLDSENASVHQDLSMLAMQQRNFPLLVELRRKMLGQRPSLRMSWTSLVVAQYYAKDYAGAEKTLRLYENFLASEKQPAKPTLQHQASTKVSASEIVLFRVKAIADSGSYEAALTDLQTNRTRILDQLSYHEREAELLAKLGRRQEAVAAYRNLIKRNPNDRDYYIALEAALDVTLAQLPVLYANLAKKYPTAEVPKARPFEFLEGDDLHRHAKQYISEKLDRGVPSTFALVKSFYKKHPKIARAVGDEILAEQAPDVPDKQAIRSLFLTMHLANTGRVQQALEEVNAALAATPTLLELALAKAKVLKRLGDFAGAAKLLEETSQVDKGDRFLNTLAAKYALRANEVAKGVEIASVFPLATKYASNDAIRYLNDLEAVNLLTELAAAYSRVGDHGMALKRSVGVINIFSTYNKDQYDFHYYGPRRGTLRAYLDMVDWEDNLYRHPKYFQAAKVAIDEYIALATNEDDGLSDEQKAQAKAERVKALKKLEDAPPEEPKEGEEPRAKDTDPFGQELLKTKDPLEQAFQIWKPLSEAVPTLASTWELAFEIYIAQNKYVLATQALKKAKEYGASPSWVAYAAVKSRHTLESDTEAPQVIRGLQLKMLPTIVPGIADANLSAFVDEHITDPLLWLRARAVLGSLEGVEATLAEKLETTDVTTAAAVALQLKKLRLEGDYASAVHKKWPAASFI